MSNATDERIFGTDGIRGRAGEGWLSEERVSALGRALGKVLPPRGGTTARALIAHDGRRSGPGLEAALARGLAESNYESVSAGLFTTPGLALCTRRGDYSLGAMLSASHNPARDNGIKVFSGLGEKLNDELELAVEKELRANLEPAGEGPRPAHDTQVELDYLAYLVDVCGQGLELDGMRIVIDCAHGGGSRVAPRVLGRLGAQVISIGAEPDGDNINQGVGATAPEALVHAVRSNSAQLGIALDGDGDRCILVDDRGEVVHGDGILTVCGRHLATSGALEDPRIVATVMSNRGLHKALREVGVEVITVGVGDRQVVDGLRQEGLCLGGEQSGHIIFGSDHHHIGDGIYTALRVLRVMQETGRSLSELASPYRPFPQVLLNVPVTSKPPLTEIPEVERAMRNIETELGRDGRVLLRYSGTENLARVMVEGPDRDTIQAQAEHLANLIAEKIGGE